MIVPERRRDTIGAMRIAQIILGGASPFELKCQRVDASALANGHEVFTASDFEGAVGSDVAHVYGPSPLPRLRKGHFAGAFVASGSPHTRRVEWRAPARPAAILSPLRNDDPAVRFVPEGVESHFFDAVKAASQPPIWSVGSYDGGRPGVTNAVEQARHRMQRFRDDVRWVIFDWPPSAGDLAGVDVWVDPATVEDDWNGFTAEALVTGIPVVATRTGMNAQRLENGRIGFLVPPRDPNELTHAILSCLFKPEVSEAKASAARQTISKFRPRQRMRALVEVYASLVP